MNRDQPRWHTIGCVFLPFAAGYFLSYVYRTINGLISRDLATDLSLSPSELGLLTSVLFLSFAAVQLPLGLCIDRYGPRRVQSVLLPVAALGALAFAASRDVVGLIVGRSLIGLGTAAALIAGLKALAMTFPPAKLPLLNGAFVALGALGAISATAPAGWLLELVGWRGLFVLLAVMTVASALLICFAVPSDPPGHPAPHSARLRSFRAIVLHADFIRLAPLSASCVGMAWSVHGLWAASWLADIENLNRSEVAWHLLFMGICLCIGALGFGLIADRLQRRSISLQEIMLVTVVIFMATETALILRWPAPAYLLLGVIAVMGAATVLSFSLLGQLFSKDTVAQANAALNVAHVMTAFVLQYVTGLILQRWPSADGHVPLVAYQTAFAFGLALQTISLALFVWPVRDTGRNTKPCGRAEIQFWRRAAITFALTSIVLGGALIGTNVRADIRSNGMGAVSAELEKQAISDAEISYLLARFIENVRSLSTDAVVVRARWLEALNYTTPSAAKVLNDAARNSHLFMQISAQPIMVDILSVTRRSDDLFEIGWSERTFEGGRLVRTDNFLGKLAVVIRPPHRGSSNPFGLYVDHFAWNAEPVFEPLIFDRY
jgi:type IV secretory pathway TrbF-like protein/predicted MFS family arabinose efflux permease